MRRELAELDSLRRRLAPAPPAPAGLAPELVPPDAADSEKTRRAVDVVEHVLLDFIFTECCIEAEWELEIEGGWPKVFAEDGPPVILS